MNSASFLMEIFDAGDKNNRSRMLSILDSEDGVRHLSELPGILEAPMLAFARSKHRSQLVVDLVMRGQTDCRACERWTSNNFDFQRWPEETREFLLKVRDLQLVVGVKESFEVLSATTKVRKSRI